MTGTLISLGSINADIHLRLESPLEGAETSLATGFNRFSGGKASNTAYLGRLFGHRSVLLGRVGDDDLAEQALAPLRQAGVMLDGVSRSTQSTAVSMIAVPPQGKKQIVLATNANDDWDEPAIERMLRYINAAAAPACLVVDCEVPAHVVERALHLAQSKGLTTVLDPSFPERVTDAMLAGLDAITPNTEEAEGILGTPINTLEQAADAARALSDKGVALVCVKLEDGGAVVAQGGRIVHVPSGKVDVVDSTGAGDAFTGVLAIALLDQCPPLEAVTWAVAAADFAVQDIGSQESYAARGEVEARAQTLMPKVRELAHG